MATGNNGERLTVEQAELIVAEAAQHGFRVNSVLKRLEYTDSGEAVELCTVHLHNIETGHAKSFRSIDKWESTKKWQTRSITSSADKLVKAKAKLERLNDREFSIRQKIVALRAKHEVLLDDIKIAEVDVDELTLDEESNA